MKVKLENKNIKIIYIKKKIVVNRSCVNLIFYKKENQN